MYLLILQSYFVYDIVFLIFQNYHSEHQYSLNVTKLWFDSHGFFNILFSQSSCNLTGFPKELSLQEFY